MSRFYQLDVQQDLDARRRQFGPANVPRMYQPFNESERITFAPFIKSMIRSRTQTRAPSGTAA
jgi:hypothetical protein